MVTAQQIRTALAEIEERSEGILHPETVVEEARTEDHPLHSYFQWDDSIAAQAHRLDQARRLIRSVRVESVVSMRRVETVYYVRNPNSDPDKTGYVSLLRLRSEVELAREVIAQEFARAATILKRARDLAAVLDNHNETPPDLTLPGITPPAYQDNINDMIVKLKILMDTLN